MFPPAWSAKLKIICVKKEQKSAYLDTSPFKLLILRIWFEAILKRGQPASKGSAPPPPLNETLQTVEPLEQQCCGITIVLSLLVCVANAM